MEISRPIKTVGMAFSWIGVEALEEFREAKHIYIDYDHKNKDWWFGMKGYL